MILTSNSCDMNLNPHGVLGLSVFLRIPVSEPPRCTDPISRLATGSLLTDLKTLFQDKNCLSGKEPAGLKLRPYLRGTFPRTLDILSLLNNTQPPMQPSDSDDDDGDSTGTPKSTNQTSIQDFFASGDHQESNEFTSVQSKNKKNGSKFSNLGKEKTTRYKYRLQVHMSVPQDANGVVQVAALQRKFVDQIYSIDNSILLFRWQDSDHTNPITKPSQLPTGKDQIEKWISGTNAFHGQNHSNILKFFLLVETSMTFSSFRKSMRPWLDHNNHRMWITKLSTTNNRTLAWLKFAHPEWSRYEALKTNLSSVIIQNSKFEDCEIDLRPRKTRVGRGPNAVFVYAITISCSVKNIEKYMEALIMGYSSGKLPSSLAHTEIIPFQGITKLVSNEAVIAHALEHNQVIPRLHKRSVFGYHDIFSKQPTSEKYDGYASEMSIHECLIKKTSKETSGPLFHSIESRGSSGFLLIYFDSYESEAMDVIDNLGAHLTDVFMPELVHNFRSKISTTPYSFLQYSDDQSEVSQLSTAETYYTKIQPGTTTIVIPPPKAKPAPPSANSVASNTPSTKRSYIQLNYGDEVSSLGSKSANQLTWASVANPNNKHSNEHDKSKSNNATSDEMTIATMKSELQTLLEDSRRDIEKQLASMQEQNAQATAAIAQLRQQHQEAQDARAKDLADYKDNFRSDLLSEVANCIQVTVKQQFHAHLQSESPVRSPARKLPKNDDGDFSATESIEDSPTDISESPSNSYHSPATSGNSRSRTGLRK